MAAIGYAVVFLGGLLVYARSFYGWIDHGFSWFVRDTCYAGSKNILV